MHRRCAGRPRRRDLHFDQIAFAQQRDEHVFEFGRAGVLLRHRQLAKRRVHPRFGFRALSIINEDPHPRPHRIDLGELRLQARQRADLIGRTDRHQGAGRQFSERIGLAGRQHAPAEHQGHAMESAGLVHVGGGHQRGDALLAQQAREDGPEVAARNRIDAGGRLVEDDERGFVDQGADQPQLLLHAARQLLHRAVRHLIEPCGGQQLALALGEVGFGHQAQAGKKVDVLFDRQIGVQVLAQALGHQADAVLDALAGGVGREVFTKHLERAGVVGQHAGRRFHEARFARAVGADQAEDLAAPDVEIEPVDRRDLAVTLDEAACAQHRTGARRGLAHQRGLAHSTPSFQRITASAGRPGVSLCPGFWSK